jgi:hypothetical protein
VNSEQSPVEVTDFGRAFCLIVIARRIPRSMSPLYNLTSRFTARRSLYVMTTPLNDAEQVRYPLTCAAWVKYTVFEVAV